MIPLLEADELVMQARDQVLARTVEYGFLSPSGVVLGFAQERRSTLRTLRRLFARQPGRAGARLYLLDAERTPILVIAKRRLHFLGRLRVTVSRADGPVVGSAKGTVRPRPSVITLADPTGTVLGELCGGYGDQFDLVDSRGAAAGVVARRLISTGALPPGVRRCYDISFRAGTGAELRTLVLATLPALDMRHL